MFFQPSKMFLAGGKMFLGAREIRLRLAKIDSKNRF
jgi:hypothetical protein